MTIEDLSKEMKGKKARCSQYCPTWNCEDNDCEIYGVGHVPPSRCSHFLQYELKRREKMMNIGDKRMTKQECRERGCPFFNDELDNCEFLGALGCTIDDVDSCVGIRITEEASE